MDEGYKIRNKDGIYFITFALVEWIDAFTRKEYAEIVIENLKYCQKEKGILDIEFKNNFLRKTDF